MTNESTVTIYGSSDDLIELEGGISEEFTYPLNHGSDCDGVLLAFGDGTLLRMIYDEDGVWRITVLIKGTASLSKTEGEVGADDNYTDRLTLVGDLRWAVVGDQWAQDKKKATA